MGCFLSLVWEAGKQELAVDSLLPEKGECCRKTRDTELFFFLLYYFFSSVKRMLTMDLNCCFLYVSFVCVIFLVCLFDF